MKATASPKQGKRRIKKEPQQSPLHFLIAEAEPAPAELIRRGLLSFSDPYRLTVAGTLADARACISSDPPDLLLFDLHLPDGGGEDLLPDRSSELRFPAIAMIDDGKEEAVPRLLERGVVDYLVKAKPAFDDLPHIVGHAMQIWKIRQSQRMLEWRLTTQESLVRTMMENPVDVIALLDRKGTILDLNNALAERMGKARPDMIGTRAYDHLPDQLARSRQEQIERVFETGIPARFEDGLNGKWYDNMVQPVRDRAGGITQAVVIARDITVRKLAENALRESETRFKALIQNASDMIRILDKDLNILYESPSSERIHGYPPGALTGKNAKEYIHPDDRARIMGDFRAVLNRTNAGIPTEFRIRRVDGAYIWVESSAVNLLGVPGVDGIVITTRQIEQRRRMESALKESEERYRDLFNLSPVGTALTDPAGNILEMNNTLLEMFGYTRDEIGSVNMTGLYADPEARKKMADTLLSRGSVSDYELVLRCRNGSVFPAVLHSSLITQGQKQLFQTSLFDITDRKMMEEEIRSLNRALEQRVIQRTNELNASLGEKEILLREIHHRVKNNLQIIVSILRLQNRHTGDPGTQAIILDSESRVRSMALVHEKLYRSADLAHIDIGDYLRDLARYLFNTYAINPSQVALRVEIKGISLDINRAIPVGLILNELITNALKHGYPCGRQGEMQITGRQDGSGIVFSVDDDGVGMPDGFDWRHSPSLGMHLVVTLIEQVRGTIECTDCRKGTHFVIRIPPDPGTAT